MFSKLYLIRHGETVGAEERRYKGHIDVPLSERGAEQVKRLSSYLASQSGTRVEAVYCSDLRRAVNSAEIIAAPFGLAPVVSEDLRERHFGLWEGMTFEEIQEQYPDDFRAWADDPLRFSPLKGETTLEARHRTMKALSMIGDRHDGREVAIVSHGGITRILLCELLGVPLENLFRIEQNVAALNIIEFHDGYPVVTLLNYVHP